MGKIYLILLTTLAGLTQMAAQNWIQANSPDFLTVPDGQTANVYPSVVSFSGQQPYITAVRVNFPEISGAGDVAGLDFLLESPSGTKVILQSDLSTASPFFQITNIWYHSEGTLFPLYFGGNALFHPVNAGSPADTFPSPGPGIVMQPDPTFAAFLNENPNGTWKLWVVDDTTDGSIFYFNQKWNMAVKTSPAPVCPYPEPPMVVGLTDYAATIAWTGNGPADSWDIYLSMGFDVPDENTVPTVAAWPHDTIVLNDLTPGSSYTFWVRSVCPDGGRSAWITISFNTTFTPCEHTRPVGLCQEINCDTIPRQPSFFFVESNCGTGTPEWFFTFTPEESGPYWFNMLEFGTRIFWRPDTAATDCPIWDWNCIDPGFEFYKPLFWDTLTGGQTYILMMENTHKNPFFSISECPFPRVQAYAGFSSTDSLSLLISNLPVDFESDSIEVYITPASMPAPDSGTPPTPGAHWTDSTFTISAGGLPGGTAFHFYIRKRCDAARVSCWQGPFGASTQPLCSQAVFLGVDTVTYSWADITFTWDKYLAGSDNWTLRLVLYGQYPETATAGDFNINANSADTIRYRLHNIPSYQPLQIYLKAHCSGISPESQPWQGPFDLPAGTTPPIPIEDIYCGEGQDTYPDEYDFGGFLYVQNPCYPYYVSMSERILRYRANQDGMLEIAWNAGFGGNAGSGTGFFIKSAGTVPGNQGWTYLGCWKYGAGWNPAAYELPPFEVQKDSTYYILCDGFDGTAAHVPGSFPFYIDGCEVTCAVVDTILVDAFTSTTATLRWNNAAPGGHYQLSYRPAAEGLTIGTGTVITTDTFAVLTGLVPSAEYLFSIRTFCSPTDPSREKNVTWQLGDNRIIRESFFSRCNPLFEPPGSTAVSNYEVFEIRPPLDGNYLLTFIHDDGYLYADEFQPGNPEANLLASTTEYGPNGRKELVHFLEAGKTYYWVAAGVNGSFYLEGYHNLSFVADGPAELQVITARWNTREPGPHGSLSVEYAWVSGVCPDTSGWVHFYQIGDPENPVSDKLLLSLKGYPDPGKLAGLPLLVGAFGGVSKITNPPAPFVMNPSGWYEMKRFWVMQDLTPEQQTDSVMTVRFYYTQKDFDDLKTAIESEGGQLQSHEDMYFHKINGFHHVSNIDPTYGHPGIPAASAWDQMGYWEYANGTEAGPDTWRHGAYGNDHYAEMTIRGFSGGGGGGSVNGRGALDATVKTTNPNNLHSLAIWPNPTSGAFTLELVQPAQPGLIIRITDLTGRLVRETEIQPGSIVKNLELNGLPDGIYVVQILTDNRMIGVSRVLKQE